jgi:hypothetical protein
MKTFFARLVAPRSTFVQDMTPAERNLMMEHGKYWRSLMDKGYVVAFGMVAHPDGGFGVGILEVPDDMNVTELTNADPTITSQTGFRYDIAPMPMGAVHK